MVASNIWRRLYVGNYTVGLSMSKRFSAEQVRSIEQKLKALPKTNVARSEMNKVEAIKMLSAAVRAAQKNGHTLDELAKQLGEWGFEISPATLKNYLLRARPSLKKVSVSTSPISEAMNDLGNASTAEVR